MVDDAHRKPERVVNLAHPDRIAAGEGIVDRDDVYAFTREAIQICGERRDQGLTFARAHLRNVAAVEYHASDKLDIEVSLPQSAPRRFTHRGKRFGGKLV